MKIMNNLSLAFVFASSMMTVSHAEGTPSFQNQVTDPSQGQVDQVTGACWPSPVPYGASSTQISCAFSIGPTTLSQTDANTPETIANNSFGSFSFTKEINRVGGGSNGPLNVVTLPTENNDKVYVGAVTGHGPDTEFCVVAATSDDTDKAQHDRTAKIKVTPETCIDLSKFTERDYKKLPGAENVAKFSQIGLIQSESGESHVMVMRLPNPDASQQRCADTSCYCYDVYAAKINGEGIGSPVMLEDNMCGYGPMQGTGKRTQIMMTIPGKYPDVGRTLILSADEKGRMRSRLVENYFRHTGPTTLTP